MHDHRPVEPDFDPGPDSSPAPGGIDAPPVPAEPAAPVTGRERILTLDLLRGFALLGILLVNVWAYALPFPAAMNPNLSGWDTPVDRIMSAVVHLTVYTKTMPIFSMLFGAGVLLMATRQTERGNKPFGLIFRRQFWLLVIGMVHSYLLWDGDILVPYAGVGMIVYFFRNRRPRTLLILAVVAMLVPKLLAQGGGWYMQKMEAVHAGALQARAAGDSLTVEQEQALEIVGQNEAQWNPTPEQVDEMIAVKRGSYSGFLAHNVPEVAVMHLVMYPLYVGWNLAGFMLLGMMLLKTGVLTGERPVGFYRRLAGVGYGLGVPLSVYAFWFYDRHPESFATVFRWGFPLVDVAGPLVALGHVALVILAFLGSWLPGLQVRLRAVGRMALTNYIAHTVICTLIFHGYGLAQWGAWDRAQLMLLALAIGALQLWWSPWWLARFRFGPLEWLWRSLTYRKWQAFRI